MAGIGFELRRMLHGDRGITGRLQALLTATLITAGPWLVTMVTLLLVTFALSGRDPRAETMFRTLVTYVFAASMIVVGGVQMPMTRHIADLLHERRYERVLPAFVAAAAGVAAFQAVCGAAFARAIGLAAVDVLLLASLYVAVSLNWLAMAWLTVIRQHVRIFAAFALGLVGAVAMAWNLRTDSGLTTLLLSFATGQGLTFVLLAALIVRGLEHGSELGGEVFASVRRYPQLLVIGVAHAAGIWADKVVFWLGDGIATGPWLRAHPLYDTSCFLAYLTVVPALALNLIALETRFYERYRTYYAALQQGLPLREVEWHRTEMAEALRHGAILLLRWQGLFTTLAIVFAPPLLALLGMPDGMIRPFRLACLGAFFQVLFLIALLVLLYFDLRRPAMLHALTFLLLNVAFALVSLLGDYPVYGAGYAVAGLVSLFLAWRSICRALPELEYHTLSNAART